MWKQLVQGQIFILLKMQWTRQQSWPLRRLRKRPKKAWRMERCFPAELAAFFEIVGTPFHYLTYIKHYKTDGWWVVGMEFAFMTLLVKDVLTGIGDRWSKILKGRYCMGSFCSAEAKGCNYLVLGLEKKAVIKAREEAQDWQTYDT